jgi:cyclin B
VLFKGDRYLEKQPLIFEWMRSLLVDWMVEVQESFRLNHETLYLAVKLVDLYLMKVVVSKETLQLIGAAAMLIAVKYDVSGIQLYREKLYIS